MKKVVVVGAGASGMMAAIFAARNGAKVIVLEHSKQAGKKILQTGNGRCNLTNLYIDENCYQNEDNLSVLDVIKKFSPEDTIDFFAQCGVKVKVRKGYANSYKEQYVYPNSDQAVTVLESLLNEINRLKIDIIFDADILNIKREKSGFNIDVKINEIKKNIVADSVILATGSKAAPKTGSDGSGYELSKRLGHKIVKPLPALVPLETDYKDIKLVSGVRCDGVVSLCYKDGTKIAAQKGEIQFTDYGISGIPVFQISRYAVKNIDENKKIVVHIDLLPEMNANELKAHFEKMKNTRRDMEIVNCINGLLNNKLSVLIVKNIFKERKSIKLDKLKAEEIEKICEFIKNFSVNIVGFKSYDKGQICIGGVNLKDVNLDTMESKLLKGLFFCGELLDVDGICGGYNLQWAWSSGYLAGVSAAK